MSRFRRSSPVSTAERALKLRSRRPAPTSSTSATAISAATSTLRTRRLCVASAPRAPPSRRSSFGDDRDTCHAGRAPKTSPVPIAATSVKARTTGSVCVSASRRTPPGLNPTSAFAAQDASQSPATLPAIERTTASVSSWRTMRARDAPRARRTAISRRRDVPRPSSRLATLAQAIASTNPTAASRTPSGRVTGPKNCSRSGTIAAPRPPSLSGYSCARRAARTSASRRACSSVTSSRSRATILRMPRVRSADRFSAGLSAGVRGMSRAAPGIQSSGELPPVDPPVTPGQPKSWRITATTCRLAPLIVMSRPMMPGSDPKRRTHNP